MNIYYSDEEGRLDSEIKSLMEKAALKALSLEFPDVLEEKSMKPEDLDAEIGVTVVDAEEIRSLNRDYRGNDSVTDVLSFPQYDDMEELAYDLGDEEYGARKDTDSQRNAPEYRGNADPSDAECRRCFWGSEKTHRGYL